jgi:hypothetical protein
MNVYLEINLINLIKKIYTLLFHNDNLIFINIFSATELNIFNNYLKIFFNIK